ncbi:MAG TPA: hypothetical protein DCS93_31530 [Microscillaceae bacterium]|nr:hypothetical protein [Microscillaceae bacterium]
MYYLSEEKVDWILEDLRSQGLTHQPLEGELLDHICCAVEETMWDHNTSFEQAYQQTLVSFGEEGILKVQKATKRSVERAPLTRRMARMSTLIAACLILFIGVVVQAQERPDSHPLNQEFPVVSGFGHIIPPFTRQNRFHRGVDIKVPVGTQVFATANGTVTKASFDSKKGYYITIKHDDAYSTTYTHLSKLMVKPGDKVKKRTQIALSGNTGHSTAPHLHYEVHKNGQVVDPKKYFGK